MDIIRLRALRGPNLWGRHTAMEATIACPRSERTLADFPGIEARVQTRFPALGALRAAGEATAIPLPELIAIAALSLQNSAGCPVTFYRCASTVEDGVYQVVVEYSEEAVGRLAFEQALALYYAARDDLPFDAADALARLRALDEDERLGPSTGAIVDAAVARGIPYRRLTSGSLVQFGWGARQRRIQAAEIDRTSAIAESIAQDKQLTKQLLLAAGVPVPEGRPVNDAESAWTAAQEIMRHSGSSVVIKPQDGNQGKGVTVDIRSREAVLAAYAMAANISDDVLVERYFPGHDFRLLVVGDRLVAAARRDPPQVIGDGQQSIRALVEAVNRDPRRGEGHATSLTKIRLDEIALATLRHQRLTPESVPSQGQRVVLRNNANLSTGGTATDVTDDVHPQLAARAIAAATMVGLDICGVDVVCGTVTRPLEAQGGGIVEVNAAPGLRMHLAPSYGKGRAVGEAIIEQLFPAGKNGRIPLVAVAGTNGKTTTVRLIAHLQTVAGRRVGMTTTDGVYIAGRRIDSGDCSGPKSARNVLLHPDVDAAVLETARGGILREGLAFDHCDVAVVTNIGLGDHLGLNYITTVEDLAVVKRVIVDNVAPTGMTVLNAADPIVARKAAYCPSAVTFFAADGHHPVLASHRARQQRVVFRDGVELVAAEGEVVARFPLADIPLTHAGALTFQVENVMAAIAAVWALGLDWATVRRGLASFISDAATVPGRFNVFDYRGATLIADYGHNPDAIVALVRAVEVMPGKRRTAVISAAGDRRDEDIRHQSQLLGAVFDRLVLYEDACQRGRAPGETLALLREGLAGATRTQIVEEIHGEFRAIDQALAGLAPGDLCLILIDQIEEALAHIAQRVAAG
ncbi:cyanophycin synthetase [Rugosibacter aromaticivorans]|uniref:Cyanophycin synthetase n=1 Tax=Rugosibacter aromaticivorans TaxID=1565605 RepID=A0A0C5J742_9PROT|nr:cyanophycin synthetase [Rugosibacter aromaticivorans]AJP47469.1 cyanophycin synthetase [Rugosibacter aromaticivorans]